MAIINTYDQLKAAAEAGFDKGKLVGIGYHAPDAANSRDISVKKWSVFSPFFKTDPSASWYDNGRKTFSLGFEITHKQRKDAALALAKTWAEAAFGIVEWSKNRMGVYVPKEVNDKFPIPKREK